MEVKAPGLAPTHLHSSEVGIAREGKRRQLLGGRRPTVTLNNKKGHTSNVGSDMDVSFKGLLH
jgi:hypothetical protein